MYTPSLEQFLKLSDKGNLIPVYRELNADLDTPVSAYLKVCRGDYSFLFESVEGREKIARYSFLGNNPSLIFQTRGREVRINYPFKKKNLAFTAGGTPLDEIKKIMRHYRAVGLPELPRFYGGLVGYIGYDTVRFFEELPEKNPDELKLPDTLLILADTLLIFDRLKQKIIIVSNCLLPEKKKRVAGREKIALYLKAVKKIESLQKQFNAPFPASSPGARCRRQRAGVISSNFTKGQFCRIVKAAKEYIKKGDIIQVVLSQRLKIRLKKNPFEVYRALRNLNPSPYMFFLKFNKVSLVGASPEMLVRCEEGLIQTRPIAGTRPRGKTEKEDSRFQKELLGDRKEKAEHLMLVDLSRNDLGRVSLTGRVFLSEFMKVEKYSHVMHLVSEVRGTLDKKRFDVYDVLRAVFPAGTVTGSPKIRAMEIIEELENIRRGPYAGCVGYFSFSHNLDTCIAIRTIMIKDGYAYIQAGAGIVADSLPGKEYAESLNKAKAMVEAVVK